MNVRLNVRLMLFGMASATIVAAQPSHAVLTNLDTAQWIHEKGGPPESESVMLREDPGIDEVAPVHIVAPIRDGAFRDLQARRTRIHHAAVAAQRELHPEPARAMLEVLHVRAKEIVPLDDVGIALTNYPHHFGEHRGLVHLVAANHAFETRIVSD